MTGSDDGFGDGVPALENVRQTDSTEYLYEYTGVLSESGEQVQISALAPKLADTDAAVDAFTRVSDQWHNAGANATIRTVLDRGTEPRPWIAVPDHDGDTLDALQSELPPDRIETVIAETADALRTLGLYNTVHGYLSPDGIYLPHDSDGTVEVGEFGLEAAIQTAVGEFEPTPYTAPELVDAPGQPTERTDVYGLAAVTYFALTGHPPVEGDDLDRAIRDGPPEPPSEYTDEVSPALDDAVMRALSVSPGDRHESPHAFKRAYLSAFDADAFETEADESGDDTEQSSGTDAAEATDEEPDTAEATDEEPDTAETDQQAATDNDGDGSRSATERAALSLLGLVVMSGAGLFLFGDQLRQFLFVYGPGAVAVAGGGYHLLATHDSAETDIGQQLLLGVSIIAGSLALVLSISEQSIAALVAAWVGCFALVGWGASVALNQLFRS